MGRCCFTGCSELARAGSRIEKGAGEGPSLDIVYALIVTSDSATEGHDVPRLHTGFTSPVEVGAHLVTPEIKWMAMKFGADGHPPMPRCRIGGSASFRP